MCSIVSFAMSYTAIPAPSPHSGDDRASSNTLEMKDVTRCNVSKVNRPPTSFFRLTNTWKWEISTWLLGSAGYIANLILVGMWNGKLQKDWHSNIQITTFVAALAQVSQSALMVPTASSIAQLKWKWVTAISRPAIDINHFDLASRGPDGSLRLLWHLGWRQ